MTTKSFFLILGSIILFSCSQEKKLAPKRTVVAGIVSNFSKNEVLTVNYCDVLFCDDDNDRFYQDLTESNGYFQTEYEYALAQNITIKIANKFINLFIRPGDSIFVSIDAKEVRHNFDNAVTFSGDNAKVNKELFAWHNYSFKHYLSSKDYDGLFADSVSPEDFLANVKHVFNNAQDSINAYAQRTSMSSFLKRWAYVDYKFTVANVYLMDYNNLQANKWDIFTNSIIDVFNEDNFQSMYFPYHLYPCMNALTTGDAEVKRLTSEKKYAPAIRLTIEKLHEKAPEGSVRDAMLFNFLKGIFEAQPALYDSIPELKAAFSQNIFSKQLEKFVEKSKNKVPPPTKVSASERLLHGIWYMGAGSKTEKTYGDSVQLLNFLTKKYKGKTLYVDVWATWCGPCLKEMAEHSPTLHKHFKGNKNVVFVNLCLSAPNLNSWKQTAAKYSISEENYLMGSHAAELFRADNQMGSYPSYFIIDKNGEIHKPAPRPSELEAAIQKIEECLK